MTHAEERIAPDVARPSTELAPVVAFAYKRLGHLRRMVDSLLGNAESTGTHLSIYCDAARKPEDLEAVQSVRRYVSSIRGFASVTPVFRTDNFGLAKSIISGVSEMLSSHDRVIVLEDDLILSPYFLRYMNDGLRLYAQDDQVASIHGYCYPADSPLPETFFLRGADCWGWATWGRAWRHFRPDGKALLDELRLERLTRRFDFDGTFDFTQMLAAQVGGQNDSWAIRWHATCFLANRLTLYPGHSLVHNGGFDSTGQHCDSTSAFDQIVSQGPVDVARLPLAESERARSAFIEFFRSIRAPLVTRLRSRLRHVIGTSVGAFRSSKAN